MRISDYLDSRLILFLDASSQAEAIEKLVERLSVEGKLPDKEAFRKAIFHREKQLSTGIGMGVAVPHAKLKGFPDFFVAVGIQKTKGLEWNALDKVHVRLIFMIGGPEDRQTEYLQILSLLTSAIRDVELRRMLLNTQTEQEAADLFSSF